MDFKGLLGAPVRPLTQDESKMFIATSMKESQVSFEETDAMAASSLQYRIIRTRMMNMADRITPALAVFVASICDRPGNAVMWAYTLCCMAAKKPDKEAVDIMDWTMEFPTGVPTDEAYRAVWESQKGHNIGEKFDNWLDNSENWPQD